MSVGNTSYKLRNWQLKMHADAVDTTNFESTGGARENEEGLKNATFTAEGPYDQGSFAITAGTTYTFVLNAGSSTFSVPIRVTDLTPSVAVDGVAVVNVEGVSNGTFTAATT